MHRVGQGRRPCRLVAGRQGKVSDAVCQLHRAVTVEARDAQVLDEPVGAVDMEPILNEGRAGARCGSRRASALEARGSPSSRGSRIPEGSGAERAGGRGGCPLVGIVIGAARSDVASLCRNRTRCLYAGFEQSAFHCWPPPWRLADPGDRSLQASYADADQLAYKLRS